jgi:hypothetical protein
VRHVRLSADVRRRWNARSVRRWSEVALLQPPRVCPRICAPVNVPVPVPVGRGARERVPACIPLPSPIPCGSCADSGTGTGTGTGTDGHVYGREFEDVAASTSRR